MEDVNMSNFKSDPHSNTSSPIPFSTGSSGYSSSLCASTPSSGASSTSPSPRQTLKRSKSSSFKLINRRSRISSTSSNASPTTGNGRTVSLSSTMSASTLRDDKLASIIGWYPSFLIRIYLELFSTCFLIVFKRLPIIIPTIWTSACLWVFTKVIVIAFTLVKEILCRFSSIVESPTNAINADGCDEESQPPVVLISGGTSVQTLHLARNLTLGTGARVVVFEVEGTATSALPLARFSTCVAAYYGGIVRPSDGRIEDYITALKEIVIREGVNWFVPVNDGGGGAYFDALAKPYLEEIGCRCFCPELRDVLLLGDLGELFTQIRMSRTDGGSTATTSPLPVHYPIDSLLELNRLYEFGYVTKERPHFMVRTGVEGCKWPAKVSLPNSRRKFRFSQAQPIDEDNPWLVVQQPAPIEGQRYVTCTMIEQSTVVTNTTCKMANLRENNEISLVPVKNKEIDEWLMRFFASLKINCTVTGHFSFYFTLVTPEDGSSSLVWLTNCEIGLRLPYLCYTINQTKLLLQDRGLVEERPDKNGPATSMDERSNQETNVEKYWLHKVLLSTVEHPSLQGMRKCMQMLWRKKDALFMANDPLPYFAYYFFQIPIEKTYSLLDSFINIDLL